MRGLNADEALTGVQRAVLIGIVAAAFLTPVVPMEVLGVIGIGLGWWLVPKFWRTVLFGAIGGVVAGAVILGTGFRVAMRVVAILDPIRRNEFTIGGTLFILIGIGAIFGGIFGITGNLAKRGFKLDSVFTAAIVPALGAMALILVAEDTRTELFELGAGAWVNIPMFGTVSYLYGVGAAWATTKMDIETRRRTPVTAGAEVPT